MLNGEGQTQTLRLTSGGYLATVPSPFLRAATRKSSPKNFGVQRLKGAT